MISNEKIGVVLPTYNNGDEWRLMIPRLFKSLPNLSVMDNLVFLINIQNVEVGDDDYNMIIPLVESIPTYNDTWEYQYIISEYPSPVSMVKIRNDAMMMRPMLKYYIFIDDDFKFNPGSSAEMWITAVKAFDENPELGSVMISNYLGGYNYKNCVKLSNNKFYMTNKGLFFRNLYKEYSPIYDKVILDNHIGGLEELIATYEMTDAGLVLGTIFNSNLTTRPFRRVAFKSDNEEVSDIHSLDNIKLSLQKILPKYGISPDILDNGDLNKIVVGVNKIISERKNIKYEKVINVI